MDLVNRAQAEPFITKDGSQIRELLAYRNSVIRNQSLAEATIAVGGDTQEHYHPKSEEIYYILNGSGRIKIDNGRDRHPARHAPQNLEHRQRPSRAALLLRPPLTRMTIRSWWKTSSKLESRNHE